MKHKTQPEGDESTIVQCSSLVSAIAHVYHSALLFENGNLLFMLQTYEGLLENKITIKVYVGV